MIAAFFIVSAFYRIIILEQRIIHTEYFLILQTAGNQLIAPNAAAIDILYAVRDCSSLQCRPMAKENPVGFCSL